MVLRGLAALLLCLAYSPLWAFEPFPTGNAGALARGFALPALGRTTVVAPGRCATEATLDLTNEYRHATNASEEIIQDGETDRLALSPRCGVGAGFEVGLEVPLLKQGGGFLDSTIEHWHGFFGLPNGGRELAPRNQYRFFYRRNGVTLLNVQDPSTRLGDVNLSTGWQAAEGVALRGLLKLPTGDADRLAGGNAGAALWMDWDPLAAATGRWDAALSAGVSLADRGDVLPEQQRRVVPFGGAGLSLHLTPRWQLLGQIYLHDRLYNGSRLDALARVAAPLTLGLRYQASQTFALDLAFQEDLSVNASPDFGLRLGLRWR